MPIGPYEDFGECVRAIEIKEEVSRERAEKICGAMERDLETASVSKNSLTAVMKPMANLSAVGKFYVRAFLIDPSLNINKWAVTAESIPQNIRSFIGKPLVLTDNFDHPGAEIESLNHWLEFQKSFKVGEIVDIVERENPAHAGSTAYYAVIEITNEDVKADLMNNNMPLYVSPAIAEPMDAHIAAGRDGNGTAISEWTGIHLAIVDQPAYGIKKAVISDTCQGEKSACLLQLRKAHVNLYGLHKCGFCVKGALAKYHKLMKANANANNKLNTSLSQNSSPTIQNKSMSELQSIDSSTNVPSSNDSTKGIEKVEEPYSPPATKQPVNPPPSNTPANIRDLLTENQRLLHELELSGLKIKELTEAHSTVQERIAALELRDRRKDIERIITPDIIKDDKARLEKIKYYVGTTIPINEIEAIYSDLKVAIKKASINNGRGQGAKVPYGVTSNLSGSTNFSNNMMIDEETGLSPLQKQMAVLKGGLY